MKKILLTCASVFMLAGAANAATYTPFVTANPYFAVPPTSGLNVKAASLSNSGAQAFNGATYTFDLTNVGDSASMDIFSLITFDAPIDADDLVPKPSTATFDFGGIIGAITLMGTTSAVSSMGYAIATYVSDVINVGGGQGIVVSLSDTIFATDGTSFVNGSAGKGFVNATFTLAAVPVPAALPLSLAALGLMGFVGRRRKSNTAA